LIALAIACWPGQALLGMLIYVMLATVYLAYLLSAANASGRCCGRQLSFT